MFLAESYLLQAICQSNEPERDIKHKTGGGQAKARQKSGGPWTTQTPLRSATASGRLSRECSQKDFFVGQSDNMAEPT